MKRILSAFFTFVIFLLSAHFLSSTHPIYAGTFQLTDIGDMPTNGHAYAQWWYTNGNPVLKGTTTASTAVTITVDGTANTAQSDASGAWSYALSGLADGDHAIALSSDAGNYSFTLTIGEDLPTGISAPAASDVPVAGSVETTLLLTTLGIVILGSGVFLARRNAFVRGPLANRSRTI